MRVEPAKARAQDHRKLDGKVDTPRAWVQETNEGNGDAVSEARQGLRQVHAEIAAAEAGGRLRRLRQRCTLLPG